MKKVFALGLGLAMLWVGQASAGFMVSSGDGFKLNAAPSVVKDDAVASATGSGTTLDPYVMKQWGFFERAYVLTAPLSVDTGSAGSVGQVVESYMIFLNKPLANRPSGVIAKEAEWKFDNVILGVMSDQDGVLEFGSPFLQAAGSDYGTQYDNRGLEGNARKTTIKLYNDANDDAYFITPTLDTLKLKMQVQQPGDWIRVITTSNLSASQVPEPTTMALFGLGAIGMGCARRLRRRS